MKTTLVSEWKDDFGNRATIEEAYVKAHKDAKQEKAYRLSCYAEYNEDFLYHVSVHETIEKAENQLTEFSCETFKNVLEIKAENIIDTLKKEDSNFFLSYNLIIRRIRENIKSNKKYYHNLVKAKREIREYLSNLIDTYILDYEEAEILYKYICRK